MGIVPKRLLLLGSITGYQTRTFAQAAQRLGLEVVLGTDQCKQLDDPWGDHAITVRFQQPEGYARRLAMEGPFDAVLAVGDHPTLLAAMTAERLGIRHNSPASVRAAKNKYLARQLFRGAGLNVPGYFRIRLGAESWPEPSYPCVLKPLGLSGSRGVIRADNPRQFRDAFQRIARLLETVDIRRLKEEHNRYVQVEDFIEGHEFALEGILTAGRLQTLAIFDKPDPLDGPLFEETIYVTPSRAGTEVEEKIAATTQRAAQALGLEAGPVHAEMRVNAQGVWMLEVAARPIGGLCSQALHFEPGIPLEELILRHATGQDIAGARLASPAAGMMMIPIPKGGIFENVTGVERSRAVPKISDVIITAKQGQRLTPLPEGASYLGFIFAHGQSAASVEDALRTAHRMLEFEIATDLRVV